MKKAAQELNITYHPILDNFHEFDNLPRTVFNESLKFYFAGSLMTGENHALHCSTYVILVIPDIIYFIIILT